MYLRFCLSYFDNEETAKFLKFFIFEKKDEMKKVFSRNNRNESRKIVL